MTPHQYLFHEKVLVEALIHVDHIFQQGTKMWPAGMSFQSAGMRLTTNALWLWFDCTGRFPYLIPEPFSAMCSVPLGIFQLHSEEECYLTCP